MSNKICHFYGMDIYYNFDFNKPVIIIFLNEENKKAIFDLNLRLFVDDGGLIDLDKECILNWVDEHIDELLLNWKNKNDVIISDYVGE